MALRTDKGGEFTVNHFLEYCVELGVRCEMTTPYSPQHNGVAERRNQCVMVAVRCMMKAKRLPGMFWEGGGEVVNCDVYVLNRAISKSTGGKTPYELWIESKPAVKHMMTFGCVAHVKGQSLI
jgi:transposase InsO family protein